MSETQPLDRRRMRPIDDPECQKYIDDPTHLWYGGQWRTLRGIEAERARKARYSKEPNNRAKEAARKRKKYATDPSYRERHLARNRATGLYVRAGGLKLYYRVAPEKKQEIRERLAAFREHQTRTRKEMADNGWIY